MRSGLAVVLLFTGAGCGERVGPLSRADSELALTSATARFDPLVWRQGLRPARGAMLVSLFRDRLAGPTSNTDVFAALGPSDCYVGYEDEPCYVVQLGQQRYDLQFAVNNSSRPGRVLSVRLRPWSSAANTPVAPAP